MPRAGIYPPGDNGTKPCRRDTIGEALLRLWSSTTRHWFKTRVLSRLDHPRGYCLVVEKPWLRTRALQISRSLATTHSSGAGPGILLGIPRTPSMLLLLVLSFSHLGSVLCGDFALNATSPADDGQHCPPLIFECHEEAAPIYAVSGITRKPP